CAEAGRLRGDSSPLGVTSNLRVTPCYWIRARPDIRMRATTTRPDYTFRTARKRFRHCLVNHRMPFHPHPSLPSSTTRTPVTRLSLTIARFPFDFPPVNPG